MKITKPVYITPDKGQTVNELAIEITNYKASQVYGVKIFLNRPDGSAIEITGETLEQIRNSILTQCAELVF